MKEFFSTHSLETVLAAAAAFSCVWLWLQKKRLGMASWAVPVFAVLHVLCGVACVRVFAFLESAGKGASGSMSLFGAVFFLPLLYYAGAKVFRRSTAEVFDTFCICTVFTLFCARINCLASGCCLGRVMHAAEGLRWPVREAEMVYYAVFLILMAPRVRRAVSGGRAYPVYMLSYGVFRAFCEFFRESSAPGAFHIAHIWAFISLAVGASVLIEIDRVKKHDKKRS